MTSLGCMIVAGEPSGDGLAAELVGALRAAGCPRPLRFFGAGGPQMAAAGVELELDLTRHAVVGLVEVLVNLFKFRRFLHQLVELAVARRPELIICVDFSGFNRRFAHALRRRIGEDAWLSSSWSPRIVQFVSPQVWASRPGRAEKMALDFDLLLTIFPFEKPWYAARTPSFHVEFVGHPMFDRYRESPTAPPAETRAPSATCPRVLLLPGSRVGELKRHLPAMIAAATAVAAQIKAEFRMVVPNDELRALALDLSRSFNTLTIQTGGLAHALRKATIALASTGTVTMECAYFGVPTVALYKTSWSTYQIGKRIIQVKYLAMPNLLANEVVFPEFIQDEATPANLARAALELLRDNARRSAVKARLATVMASLGGPGACGRAANAILNLVPAKSGPPTAMPGAS